MFRITLVTVTMLFVAGCASTGLHARPADMHRALLVSSSELLPGAHYDDATGRCSSGVQLLSQAEYKALISEWNAPANCKAPSKSRIPPNASYPDAFAKKSGSAEVLVRLESNGSVESVHAVCATDADFARAAEETTKAINNEPTTCDGVPARSTFVLPFNYDTK